MLFKKLGSLTTLKFKPALKKIFLTNFISQIIIVLLFATYAITITTNDLRQQTYKANLYMLDRVSNSIDRTINFANMTISQMMQNQSLVNTVLVPVTVRYDRNKALVNYLSEITNSNNYIASIYLLNHGNKMVYTSHKSILRLEDFSEPQLFESYDPNDHFLESPIKNRGETKTKLVIKNNKAYLISHILISGYISNAEIVMQLNIQASENTAQSIGNPDRSNLICTSSSGETLFNYSTINTGKEPIDLLGMLSSFKETGFFTQASEKSNYLVFFFKSQYSGLVFFYTVKSDQFSIFNLNSIMMFLPVILFLLVISIGLAVYISKDIYRPIGNLVQSIFRLSEDNSYKKDETSKANNEFELLNYAYETTFQKNAQLSAMVERVKPLMIEKNFISLMHGREVDISDFRRNMDELETGFSLDGNFTLILVQVFKESAEELTLGEKNLYLLSMCTILNDIFRQNQKCAVILMDEDYLAIVFEFSRNMSIAEIKADLSQYPEKILGSTKDMPFSVKLGFGHIYSQPEDLYHSYMDAKKELNYRYYLSSDKKASLFDAKTDEGESVDDIFQKYLSEQTGHLTGYIFECSHEETLPMLNKTLDEISQWVSRKPYALENYSSLLIDSILERFIALGIETNKDFESIRQNCNEAILGSNEYHIKPALEKLCLNALLLVKSYKNKRQFKHILRVKEYIKGNYYNHDLSLNKIAEHIEVNASYISTLFSENENVHFVDYLNEYRVEKSKELMIQTNLTIKDIGFKTGFNTIQNFIRVFKKHTGVTPGQYKDSL